jgi:response regulator RpfG family c-di-GMP phosphodiesterase
MSKSKVLYVDDEEINLVIFDMNLKDKYNIVTADSGQKGLEILSKDNDIAVVISDMRMPVMDGMEFIKQAKSKFDDIIFYIFTAFEVNNEIQAAIDNGIIKKYFQKPFNKQEIESELAQILINR